MNPSFSSPAQPHPQLLQYIQTELAQGYTIDQIALAARSSGWNDSQITVCIDWINNDYTNRQMSVAQTYASNAQYINQPPGSPAKRIIGILGSLFIVAAVLIACLLVYSALTSKTSDALKTMIEKNLTSASFQRNLTTKLKQNNGILSASARCDFSDPTRPKSDIQIEISYPIEGTRNALNQVIVKAESVVIGDTAWIRINDVQILMDDATRAGFASKTPTGETTDEAIQLFYGVKSIGNWSQYYGYTPDTPSNIDPSLHPEILPYLYGLTTVFNDFLIGNFGTKAGEMLNSIDNKKLYDVKATSSQAETINGVEASIYEISLNREGYNELVTELTQKFGFSQRHIEQLNDDDYTGLIEDFRVWIDEQGTLHKISSLDNTTALEYKDFGATYDIKIPEEDYNSEDLQSIQEDLRRFSE